VRSRKPAARPEPLLELHDPFTGYLVAVDRDGERLHTRASDGTGLADFRVR
jgi:hypothetical protein